MDYDYAIERYDYNRIDRLNTLIKLDTYWKDVKKLTRNVTSDHAIGRWQCLAEVRFEELKKQTLAKYNKELLYLSNELGANYFNQIMQLIKSGNISDIPSDTFGTPQLNVIYELDRDYKQLKSLNLI